MWEVFDSLCVCYKEVEFFWALKQTCQILRGSFHLHVEFLGPTAVDGQNGSKFNGSQLYLDMAKLKLLKLPPKPTCLEVFVVNHLGF